jgi:hypothetical protein
LQVIIFVLYFFKIQQNYQQQQTQPLQVINNNNQTPPIQQQLQNNAVQYCIRNGCTNQAIVSQDWEDEYCSNECVIKHCKDVFALWAQNNSNQQPNYPVAN